MLTAMATCLIFYAIVDSASLTCENGQMTVDNSIVVYTREGCHLCDLAVAMLERAGIGWRLIDIDTDPDLASRYGIHVPVLLHPGSGGELFFPFGEEQVLTFAQGKP
jgi:glutaredoxin